MEPVTQVAPAASVVASAPQLSRRGAGAAGSVRSGPEDRGPAPQMVGGLAADGFAMASFLARWAPGIAHDLTSSDCETLSLDALLALAAPEDLRRWRSLDFGYTDPCGAPSLREAIASRYEGLRPADVLCGAGAQEAVECVLRALLGPHDHAVVVLPIYPPSETTATRLCAATGVALGAPDWSLDLDAVARALRPNTKLILTNFPNSPTGAALDPPALAALVALCRRRGLWLVNDEVYRGTDARPERERPPAVVDAYERGISVDGLSKGFGLPGLRVGWAACRDPAVVRRAAEAKASLSGCLSTASEVLAGIALRAEAGIVARTRAIGRRNRARLEALAARCPGVLDLDPPRNLAFAFPRCPEVEGEAFSARLARDAELLVLPAALWRSSLAALPTDRVRIGLGHRRCEAALDALGAHLTEAVR